MIKRCGSFSWPGRETLEHPANFALLAFLLLLPSQASGQAWRFPLQSYLSLAQAQSASGAGAEEAPSLKGLPRAIAADQKPIWLLPLRAAEGHHWKPALAVTLATTGLVFLDSHDAPHFRRTNAFAGFNRATSGRNTMIGMAAIPLATLLAGWAGHNSFAEQTALQAGEAAADSQLIALGMKFASRRLRPSDIDPNGDFGHTWYKSNARFGFDSGFPSGHVITAFSIATVFAERYHRHRWVPWVAYGAAALVGFSRITLQSHFPSDVFAGAALGYSVSHFIVLRRQHGD